MNRDGLRLILGVAAIAISAVGTFAVLQPLVIIALGACGAGIVLHTLFLSKPVLDSMAISLINSFRKYPDDWSMDRHTSGDSYFETWKNQKARITVQFRGDDVNAMRVCNIVAPAMHYFHSRVAKVLWFEAKALAQRQILSNLPKDVLPEKPEKPMKPMKKPDQWDMV